MTIENNILKSALLISALFFFTAHSYSQDDVLELLPGTKVLKFDEETGIHRLLGDVNFKYQGSIMYCDSAHYHQRSKSVRAYGHVHINRRDTLNLFCDSLNYNGRTRQAKLWGNVRVRDNEYKLTTDTLEYDAKSGQAHYHYGGRVESIVNGEVLTSKVGYFHPDSKNFFFSQDVNYQGKELTMHTDTLQYVYSQKKTYFYGPTDIESEDATMFCRSGWYNTDSGEGSLADSAWIARDKDYMSGDTLLYLPNDKVAIGKGNVYYIDSTQNLSFNGDYAFNSDSLNYAFITGRAIATKEMNDDTLYIHADTLFMEKLDSNDIVKAYFNAKMYSTKMQCRADSIVYAPGEQKMKLYREPIVWSNGAELKGEFIDMDLTDSTVQKVNIYSGATILMEIEPEKYYNQIAGKNIEALFHENDLYKALVNGNATTIFFPEEEIKTDSTLTKKRVGMNRLYSSNLRIDLDSNEVTGITYLEEPDGAFYPLEEIKRDEQFVQGFDWRYILRPKSREDLISDENAVAIETPKEPEIEEEN